MYVASVGKKMIYDAIVELVGEVPAGMENVVYTFSVVVLIFIILCSFTFLGKLIKSVL